jgi:hypothetical protein
MKKFLAILALTAFCGCTQQERAKAWGGTATTTLPPGEKLVVVTWKETNLWYLTRPMKEGEVPETYTFREDSSYGMVEGKVIIREQAAAGK